MLSVVTNMASEIINGRPGVYDIHDNVLTVFTRTCRQRCENVCVLWIKIEP